MLQLSAQRSEDVAVLQCRGRMVAGEDLKELHRMATAQRAAGLVIDLREVETVDAAGLGTLLRVRQWCDSRGTSLKLVNLNRRVREVLALTALDSVIEVQSTVLDDEGLLREWACAES
jgi:anti-anti-sigma factor